MYRVRFLRIPLFTLLLFLLGSSQIAESSQPRSIMFILDASGSMNDRMSSTSRMKVALEQMESFIKTLPPETEMGLVAYGNRIPGCDSARLYSPLKRYGSKDILAKMPLFFPAGSTPIARTLELVGKHLLTGHPATEIILISDGIESCDGDPIKEIQKIKRVNPNVKMHVLGLDVLKNEERELQFLATEASGKYFPVKNQKSMEDALSSIWTGKKIEPVSDPEIPDFPDPKIVKNEEPKKQNTDLNKNPIFSEIPYIRISNIEKVKNQSGGEDFLIWYEYEGKMDSSDHTALLLFHPKSGTKATEIPKLRVKEAPSVFHAISVDHGLRSGKGYVRIHVEDGSKISVSAELWESSAIPESVAVSDEKFLSEAKSTETFDTIYR
jgi:Ca-activated chloride channel homolog